MKTNKHPGGRPLKFKNAKELQEKIDAYFAQCDRHPEEIVVYKWNQAEEEYKDADGRVKTRFVDDRTCPPVEERMWIIAEQKPYKITDLAVFLGTNRQTLINYEERDEFLDTIKDAKAKIEAFWEDQLLGPHATGPIFNLKNNFEWKDKSETDLTTNGKDLPTPILGGIAKDGDALQAHDSNE